MTEVGLGQPEAPRDTWRPPPQHTQEAARGSKVGGSPGARRHRRQGEATEQRPQACPPAPVLSGRPESRTEPRHWEGAGPQAQLPWVGVLPGSAPPGIPCGNKTEQGSHQGSRPGAEPSTGWVRPPSCSSLREGASTRPSAPGPPTPPAQPTLPRHVAAPAQEGRGTSTLGRGATPGPRGCVTAQTGVPHVKTELPSETARVWSGSRAARRKAGKMEGGWQSQPKGGRPGEGPSSHHGRQNRRA